MAGMGGHHCSCSPLSPLDKSWSPNQSYGALHCRLDMALQFGCQRTWTQRQWWSSVGFEWPRQRKRMMSTNRQTIDEAFVESMNVHMYTYACIQPLGLFVCMLYTYHRMRSSFRPVRSRQLHDIVPYFNVFIFFKVFISIQSPNGRWMAWILMYRKSPHQSSTRWSHHDSLDRKTSKCCLLCDDFLVLSVLRLKW